MVEGRRGSWQHVYGMFSAVQLTNYPGFTEHLYKLEIPYIYESIFKYNVGECGSNI